MKNKINDLLLKMQTGENCIGETANALLEVFNKNNDNILVKADLIAALNDTLLANKAVGNYKNIENDTIDKLSLLINSITI